jgi:hypothetical protein
MTDRQKKSRRAAAGLTPLSAERAAALQEQVARLGEALDAGEDPETLQDLVTPDPQDLDWDLHLLRELEKISHPAIPPLLAALFGPSPDKERRKAVKRALHILKTRGVAIPEDLLPREQAGSPVAAETPALVAHISPVYGNGDRYIIVEGSRDLLDGNLLVVQLNDETGLRECMPMSLKRKQREELWDYFHSQGFTEWAVAPPNYAVRLLEEALALTPDGEPSREAYLPLRENLWRRVGRLEDIPPVEKRLPILGLEERRDFLGQASDLAMSELFYNWIPSPEEITPWVDKLQEIEDSPLVLTEQQQHLRYEGVAEEAATALFPEETRSRWGRRLLEMAFFLDLTDRGEKARVAQAAGENLLAGERSVLTGENPFLLELARLALTLAWEHRQQPEEEPEAESSPLIVRP